MYNLYTLAHADIVQKADDLIKPLLGTDIIKVETNSVSHVFYTIYAKDLQSKLSELGALVKPISLNRKYELTVDFDKLKVVLRFFNLIGIHDVVIVVLGNKDSTFHCFL